MITRLLILLYKFNSKIIRKTIIKILKHLENGYMFSPTIRLIYTKYHQINIGYATYGGCFNLSNIHGNVSFGNYCSIAPDIKIYRANHPKNLFTMHPILYNPILGYTSKDKLERPSLVIGNDVWIGENVIILPSVNRIDDGAIIGAGSIVTKDVKAYNIIAGNPSKVIGERFNQIKQNKIRDTKWWELKTDELKLQISTIEKLINE